MFNVTRRTSSTFAFARCFASTSRAASAGTSSVASTSQLPPAIPINAALQPSTVASSSEPTKPDHFLVRLVRSSKGLTQKSHGALDTLQLRKRFRMVMVPHSPDNVGLIMRVKELVEVRNVTKEQGTKILAAYNDQSEGAGVEVTGRLRGYEKR